MKIIGVDPRTDRCWQQLVTQHSSDAFHSPAWLQVLTQTYNFEVEAYIGLDETGQPQAGLPFCRITDLKSERIVTLPFSDYCDPLVDDPIQWSKLTAPLLEQHVPFTIRCLHNDLALPDLRFTLINQAKWHGLTLQPDLDTLWQGLDSAARRAIKKAERNGVTIRLARYKTDLRAFFELHLRVRKEKYRLLAQPYRFFENIWEQFIEKQNGVLMLALYQGEIIGAVMFLEWQNKLYYKFNASNSAYIDHRPNDLIVWEGIKYGKSKGYHLLDFGLSDWDQAGLLRYKRKFATEEKTISFLQSKPNSPLKNQPEPELRHLFPQLTHLFTSEAVPDHVTEQAGELLYKYFT